MKSIKNKIILLALFSLIYCSISAQTSGYMGKKFAVGYGNTMGVSIGGYNGFDYKLHHKLTFEYFKSSSVGFRISGYYDNFILPDYYKIYALSNDNSNNYICVNENANFNVNCFGGGFALILYPKNYVAPLGLFHKIELIYYSFNSNTSLYESMPAIYKDQLSFIEPAKYTGKATYLSYGFGKKYVLFDKLLLTTGMELGMCLKTTKGTFSVKNSIESEYNAKEGDFEMNLYFDRNVTYYLNNTLFYRFDVGLAYMF